MSDFSIGKQRIGPNEPCFIIAEAGVNHNGSLEMANQMVDTACKAGADAIKFQTFAADRLVSPTAPKAKYQLRNTDADESQYEMLRRLELPEKAHLVLQNRCRERGIVFLSTPFDEMSADFLETLGIAAFKLPSGEITNINMIEYVARKGRPIILSTGMAVLEEVETAVKAIRRAGNPPLALLHCVSNYPAAPEDSNLRAMATLSAEFGVPVGYSDHTLGIEVALAAAALGACIIEKHFTLDGSLPGPDHQASIEPDGLAALIRGIHIVESAMGSGKKVPTPGECEIAAVARKSIVAAVAIPAGTVLTEKMLAVKRPGTGLSPTVLSQLIGRRARAPISPGDLITWEMLE